MTNPFQGEVFFDDPGLDSPYPRPSSWCYRVVKGRDLYATGKGYETEKIATQACAGIVFRFNEAKGNLFDNVRTVSNRGSAMTVLELIDSRYKVAKEFGYAADDFFKKLMNRPNPAEKRKVDKWLALMDQRCITFKNDEATAVEVMTELLNSEKWLLLTKPIFNDNYVSFVICPKEYVGKDFETQTEHEMRVVVHNPD